MSRLLATAPLVGAIAAATLSACSSQSTTESVATQKVSLAFRASVGGAPADCSTTYTGLGSSNMEVQLADARLFLSEIEIRNTAGTWEKLELDESPWQHQGVALLDFEDGTGACADSGTADTNKILTGRAPQGTYDAVRFRVGVPFELNHIDNAVEPLPLNSPGMYWTWQGGHKFLRVDWMVKGGAVPRWNVHLGSTGCASAAKTEAPAAPCSKPNLPAITIESFSLDSAAIDLDLGALIRSADVAMNTQDSPPGCMSSPTEPEDCVAVFSSLGLGFEQGDCVNGCAGQSVFAVAK